MQSFPRLAAVLMLWTLIPARGVFSADADLNQSSQVFETKLTASVRLQYLLHLPGGHAADATKRWPLILFLHGAGERGTDLKKVAVHGPPMLVTKSPRARKNESETEQARRIESGKLLRENFIIVSPQCADGDWWHADQLMPLLDEIEAKHRVDKTRIYLTGLSMGGYGSWELGLTHPERFAAVAPICGGSNLIVPLLAGRVSERSKAMKSLPIWAFHGGKDTVVPPNESERVVALLNKLGNQDAKLTVYPEAGHDSWTESYGNPEFYRWLLAHQRK